MLYLILTSPIYIYMYNLISSLCFIQEYPSKREEKKRFFSTACMTKPTQRAVQNVSSICTRETSKENLNKF